MLFCDISIQHRYGKNKLDEMLFKYGLDWSRMTVILVVSEVPGIEQNKLIPFLQTDKANVSKLLKKMVNENLIILNHNAIDKRINKCYLTEKGNEFVPKMNEILSAWESILFSGIKEDELQVYLKVSQKVSNNLLPNWENK